MTASVAKETTAGRNDALQNGAGVVRLDAAAEPDVPGGGWIAVTGGDRVRWLNGMVTNSVQALTPGDGAYSFFLNAQGRIQGDCTVWAEPDRLLLQTSTGQVTPLTGMLDRFIIMDDVEIADLSGASHGMVIAGPKALDTLHVAGFAQTRATRLLKRQTVTWQGHQVALLHPYSPLVPRFELWFDSATSLGQAHRALLEAGATACDLIDLELLRVAEGTPRFGMEIRERELPQETGQTRALHFSKGCYLGQEIVERIRSRGNVHRTFTSFTLHGGIARPGTALFAEGKEVGELTSIASAPIDGNVLALGFIRREALERAQPVTYAGGSAEPRPQAAAS